MKQELFLEHLEPVKDEIYCFILRSIWNSSDAEDVFSSVVLTAFKQLKRFEEGTNFRAWVYKIAVNKVFVANRETKRMAVSIDSISETLFARQDTVYNDVLDNVDLLFDQCDQQIAHALQELSTNERSCFLLLTLGKYSYKEISEITDIPVATVMTHLARGRARMRTRLIDYAQQQGIVRSTQDKPQADEDDGDTKRRVS